MAAVQDDDVVEEVMWTICIPLLRIESSEVDNLQAEVLSLSDSFSNFGDELNVRRLWFLGALTAYR